MKYKMLPKGKSYNGNMPYAPMEVYSKGMVGGLDKIIVMDKKWIKAEKKTGTEWLIKTQYSKWKDREMKGEMLWTTE